LTKPIDDSTAATTVKSTGGQWLSCYFHERHIEGLHCKRGSTLRDRYQGNRACGTFLL